MDNLLKDSGLSPIRSGKDVDFDLLSKQIALYSQIEHTEAWKDYQYRIAQIREATRLAIERGGLDKWGHRHDDEQRAALFFLDQLLSYLPAIKEQHANIVANLQADSARANMPLYGEDTLSPLTSQF